MVLEGVLARRMYFPEARLEATPARLGLPFEDVQLDSGGHRLHGWFVPGSGSPWLWSHGNGGNISHRLEHAALLHRTFGMPLLMYDYRGYGGSEGSPDETGTYADARAALGWLTARAGCGTGEVVAFGQSLGSAVTARLATEVRFRAVVLESAFTSVTGMVRRTAFRPLAPVFSGVYATVAWVGAIVSPLLLVHGSRDDIVPVAMGRALFEAAAPPKTFRIVPGASHNDVHLSPLYPDIVAGFLESL